jgi:hypothetical protein
MSLTLLFDKFALTKANKSKLHLATLSKAHPRITTEFLICDYKNARPCAQASGEEEKEEEAFSNYMQRARLNYAHADAYGGN